MGLNVRRAAETYTVTRRRGVAFGRALFSDGNLVHLRRRLRGSEGNDADNERKENGMENLILEER
jgi:hypothetical protein